MSYRCEVCNHATIPGVAMKRHTIKRANGSIAREVRLCTRCYTAMCYGATLEQVYRTFGKAPVLVPVGTWVNYNRPARPLGWTADVSE